MAMASALQAQTVSPLNPSASGPRGVDFQRIAADRTLWPRNLVLKAAMVMPVIFDGKEVGSVNLPAGQTVQLVSLNADGKLVVSQNGNQTTIPSNKTDFAEAEKAIETAQHSISLRNQELRSQREADTALQERLAPVSKRPAPGYTSTPGVHVLRVAGKVMQVVSGGILLTDWENRTLDPFTDSHGTEHSGSTLMDEPLLIVGVEGNFVDGSSFSGVVYPAGRASYTTVTGATKTVFRYATSPEAAIRYLNVK